MTRLLKAVAATALVVGLGTQPAIALERPRITILIEKDGATFWNGKRLKDDAELVARARPYSQTGHRISPKLIVRRGTKYKVIAHVAYVLERTGCCTLGVINTNYRK